MKPTRVAIPIKNTTPSGRQGGVVLFIALIVMVAMSLAAIALIRSVDTTNAIVGNLAFRMASILPANASIEQAASALFSDADIATIVHIPDKTKDLPDENYFACRQGLPTCGGSAEDARGVPAVLQKRSTASALLKQFDANDSVTATTDTHVTYVIERMCLEGAGKAATPGNCDLLTPKGILGNTLGEQDPGFARLPYYRVTVRVDGPQNTTSFVQAMLK
jgi:type IV pilus assembly protein PilX